jgi:phosphoribosylpyrophosphate synthetase
MATTRKAFTISPNYGWTNFTPSEMKDAFKIAVNNIRILRKEMKFSHLAFCGSSGAALAFYASMELDIPIIYVRKENETSHGGKIESNGGSREVCTKYLIVDDFVDRGTTVLHIYTEINELAKYHGSKAPVCTGAYMYTMRKGQKFKLTARKKIVVYGEDCFLEDSINPKLPMAGN